MSMINRTRQLIQRPLIWTGAAVLILSLVGCKGFFRPSGYSIRRVSDGDTLALTDPSGKDLNVRFACVDAPEVPHTKAEKQSRKAVDKNQFQWGTKAQERLQQLVEKGGNRVLLTITDTDRYGRKVSEVRLRDGTFIQEILTKEGLVMVYRPYLKDCPSSAVVEQAEAEAKKSRRGVWGDAKFVEPWAYRQKKK